MRAHLVLVHNDREFVARATVAFQRAGFSVTALTSPIEAWDHLKTTEPVNILITRFQFGPGQLTGVALARLAHSRRPMVRSLFMDRPTPARHADDWDELDGMGEFLLGPVGADDLPAAAARALQQPSPAR
jgi:DNA-binding NtrC family response regulator